MNSTPRHGTKLSEGQYRLLVPTSTEDTPEDAKLRLQTAAAIARERGGGLVIACITNFARQTPLNAIPADNPALVQAHEVTAAFVETAGEAGAPATGRIHLSHNESPLVLDAVEKYDCNGVLLTVEAGQSQRRRLLSGNTTEKVASRAECDVFVEKLAAEDTPIQQILLAVSGGPHSDLAAKTAHAIASEVGARIDVVHFLGQNATHAEQEDGEQIIEAAENTLFGDGQVETTLEQTDHVAKAIIDRSDEYDVTVLGSPTSGLLEQFVFGTVPDSVTQQSKNAVVMAQHDTGSTSVYDRWIAGDPIE